MDILDSTGLSYLISKIKAAFWSKSETTQVTVDSTPTANSTNLVTSGGVKSYVDNATPSVPVEDVTVGGSSVVSNKVAVIPEIPDEVEANPTVPSGTTPTTLNSLKIGSDYYELGGGAISTNIPADKADNSKSGGAKAIYDFVKPASQTSQPAGGMLPGVLYNLSALTGSVTISLATPDDASVANEYAFTFLTGNTAPTITWPASITVWAGNCLLNDVPVISASKYYEVSILNGIAIIIEAAQA